MKRICFITTISKTIQSFLLNLAKYLIEDGNYDVTFICDKDDSFNDLLSPEMHYIPVMMKRGISLSGIMTIRELTVILKREKYDIVQYSTPNAAFYASIAAKKAHITNRLYCQWGIRYMGFGRGLFRSIFKKIEKITCRNSTTIESESNSLYQSSLKEKLYEPDKASVIWNGSACGVNLDKYDISQKDAWRQKVREQLHIETDTVVFGYAGRITRDKGINELWKAFKMLPPNLNCRLLLVGRIDNGRSLNRNLLEWSWQDPRVTYVEWTNQTEQFYSAMDVFVSPSYREGFGLVVIEAEAMGLPVIVTNVPGQVDAIVDNVTGLTCKVKDADSLSSAMSRLIVENELRKKMSVEAFQYVKTNYEQNQLFKHILSARNRVLGNFKEVEYA